MKEELTKNKSKEEVQWHPAFYAALRLDFEQDEGTLDFQEAYSLTDAPLEIDYIIIKKECQSELHNPIGRIFKRYNIVEYKSPDDELSIHVFYKVIAYCYLYRISIRHQTDVEMSDITMTIVRHRYPRKLMKKLEQSGYQIARSKEAHGIYYVRINHELEAQIVVTSQLDNSEHLQLTALTNRISREQYLHYMNDYRNRKGVRREQAEIVWQAIVSANRAVVETWKEEERMCPAFREIMKDEIEEALTEAKQQGQEIGQKIGQEIGQKIGRQLFLIEKIGKKLSQGWMIPQIAELYDEDEKVIQRICTAIQSCGVNADSMVIYEKLQELSEE